MGKIMGVVRVDKDFSKKKKNRKQQGMNEN